MYTLRHTITKCRQFDLMWYLSGLNFFFKRNFSIRNLKDFLLRTMPRLYRITVIKKLFFICSNCLISNSCVIHGLYKNIANFPSKKQRTINWFLIEFVFFSHLRMSHWRLKGERKYTRKYYESERKIDKTKIVFMLSVNFPYEFCLCLLNLVQSIEISNSYFFNAI